ncbi:hypothetical protein [Bradyrhizobium sp. LMG 9283]|uniref:hypothetical protein n=1 Tax=Bradyrhizobium sp. LMG 9283 TaxID=592064 RepID=UPI00388D30FA
MRSNPIHVTSASTGKRSTFFRPRTGFRTFSLGRRGLNNFWQDEDQVRGVLRRTTLESYRTQSPRWETILDMDALADPEKKNWFLEGVSCLPPEERLCADSDDLARVYRFDLAQDSEMISPTIPI